MTRYVIVGAGSAGCVLANRLSADPTNEVALLEAGGEDRSPFIHMPAGFYYLMKTGVVDWGYHTLPQANLDGRRSYWPRGKVLGGSSSVNGTVYMRGHPSDYDTWAQLGNRGWSFADCLPYFRRSETWQGGADEFRGGDGPLLVSGPRPLTPLSQAWLAAGDEAGYPRTGDFNGGEQEGFGVLNYTVGNKRRSSTARAYLRPVRNRPNLTVLTGVLASRIILRSGKAVAVEYIRNREVARIETDGEIIVSGGTVNSPQLLQLSGIGDPDHLTGLGIQVRHPLPGVGENLQDHVNVSVAYFSPQPVSPIRHVRPVGAAIALAQYFLTNSGPATSSEGAQVGAFIKTRPELIAPDLQYFLVPLIYTDHGRKLVNAHGFMTYINMTRPESRGRIRIKSADPTEHPAIDPHYLQAGNDLALLRQSIEINRHLVSQRAFDAFRGKELAPGPTVQSADQIDAYIRATGDGIYHPVGTCKMGNDPMAVVDDELRVHGIDNLRVVDASIMPLLVSGNTNAPTIMIAEKAADLILGSGLAKPAAAAGMAPR